MLLDTIWLATPGSLGIILVLDSMLWQRRLYKMAYILLDFVLGSCVITLLIGLLISVAYLIDKIIAPTVVFGLSIVGAILVLTSIYNIGNITRIIIFDKM